jgi:hypothetical protein
LTDYYRVLNVTDASTTVTASVWTGNGAPNCGGYAAYLSGKSNVTVTKGIATFDQLAAYCYPGSNVTVQFTAQLSGFNRTYDMFFSVAVSFRQCVDGEVLVKNQCVQCPDGKYSFKYSPTATCTPCPPNTVGCAGGKVKAAPGYWRASKTSTVMLECPYPKGWVQGRRRHRQRHGRVSPPAHRHSSSGRCHLSVGGAHSTAHRAVGRGRRLRRRAHRPLMRRVLDWLLL